MSIGDHRAGLKDENEVVIPAIEVIIHPEYDPSDFDNDIGE